MAKNELSPRQHRFVMAMDSARTVAEAAHAVGVTERTGLKYLADPAVKRAIGQVLAKAPGWADAMLAPITGFQSTWPPLCVERRSLRQEPLRA